MQHFIELNDEQRSLALMSQSYNQAKTITHVAKTLFLYDIFSIDKIQCLKTLKSIPICILNKNISLKGNKFGKRTNSKYIYEADEQLFKGNKMTYKIDPYSSDLLPAALSNSYIYQGVVDGEKVRIVTIPFDNDLIRIGKLEQQANQLTMLDQKNNAQLNIMELENVKLERPKRKEERDKLISEWTQDQRKEHYKMFRIETLVKIMSEKTDSISLGALVDLSGRQQNIKGYLEQISTLFHFNSQAFQLIVHSQDQKEKSQGLDEQSVSMIIYLDEDDNGKIQQKGVFDSKRFISKGTIKTKLYDIRECKGRPNLNPYLATAIQQFSEVWNTICNKSSSCIGAVLKAISISSEMDKDISSQLTDLNQSRLTQKDQKGSIQESIVYTYKDIQNEYMNMKFVKFTQDQELQTFFKGDQLEGISIQKDYPLLPESIEPLIFLHEFSKLNSKFLNEYDQIDRTLKDRVMNVRFVLAHLKKVCELVQPINQTQLLKSECQDFHCKNLKSYYNFLVFLFKSLETIKAITSREFALASEMNNFFKKIQPKKLKMAQFVISSGEKIDNKEPIHYYDFYIKIIRECGDSIDKQKIQFTLLKLHFNKAIRISAKNIFDNHKVAQACRSLSMILKKKYSIPDSKKEQLPIEIVQKKLATLLSLIMLPEYSLKIYKKNHMYLMVQKCMAKLLQSKAGDEKALEQIVYAEYFIKVFELEKAAYFFKRAYESAQDIEIKRKAIEGKFKVYDYKKQPHLDERRLFDRFINKTGDYQEFTSNFETEQDEKDMEMVEYVYWNQKINKGEFRIPTILDEIQK